MNFPGRIRQLEQDENLQEAKDVLENLLDSSADSIGVVDTKGRFIRWNAASEEIFGYSMADLEDQHFSVLYEDPGELEKMLARLRRDGFIRKYEINMKKKDGTIAPFNLSINLLYDRHHNLTGSLCIARDRSDTRRDLAELQMLNERLEKEIIERKEMEGDLGETRETLRALFNGIPESIFLMDAGGIVVAANATLAKRLGKGLDEVIGSKMSDLVPTEVAKRRKTYVDEAIRTGRTVYFEDRRDERLLHNIISPITNGGGKVSKLAIFSMDITECQRAEETLRKSEQKYRLLVNQIPAILFKGYADWSIDFFDDKVEGLTGYPKEDFDSRALKFNDLVVPEDLKEMRSKFIEALRTNRSYMREYRIRRKDGALRWLQGRSQIFCDEAGRIDYVSGVLFDITERKVAEREILRLASFPRLNPNPVLEIDLVGKVTYANEYAYEVLRKLGRQDITGFLPSDLEDLIQSYREQGVKRFFREIELEGAVFAESIHVVEEFKMLRLFAVDITKHKQAEESLRDNQQFLTDIFNSIQDGMIILSLDFTIIRVNPALEKLPFVKPMVGRKCYEILHNRSEPCEECVAREVIQTGLAAEKIITVKAADRSTIFLEIHAFPLLNRTTGQVDQVIEFARNITNRKRAEEESLRFSKLESLSTLAGGIAHDFNNILTAILGNIGLAALDDKIGPRVQDKLAQAEAACLRAQALSQKLITFAKGGAPVKKLLSVAERLTESTVFACVGSPVRCETSFPENLWWIEGDPGQIGQVFQNLTINAVQAMPTGGTIKVWAENLTLGTDSGLPLSARRYIKISLRDQGMGIPAEHLPRIFDPYFTTKQKGSGLGLASAYAIVEKHHGHIAVESKPGVGTNFHIYLPAVDQQVPQPAEDRA
ncbi:MAG: PAS domain S-box protein, partial [Desulfobaccales bacterium]